MEIREKNRRLGEMQRALDDLESSERAGRAVIHACRDNDNLQTMKRLLFKRLGHESKYVTFKTVDEMNNGQSIQQEE